MRLSHYDNCNSLYSQKSLRSLQLLQNAAARLYISPILASLHWLHCLLECILK